MLSRAPPQLSTFLTPCIRRTRPPPAATSRICLQCLHHLSRPSPGRLFSSIRITQKGGITSSPTLRPPRKPVLYFIPNLTLPRRQTSSTTPKPPEPPSKNDGTPPPPEPLPPHRRRRRKPTSDQLPLDAPSLLSTASASAPNPLRRLFYAYLALTKPRLTALIVLTTMATYALFPVDPLLASPAAPTLSALTLVYLTTGTALSSASANAFNMYLEPSYDALMSRTRNRPLVRGLLTRPQALLFGTVTGTLGVASLYLGVNPTVAALGALNIFLYAGVYTPMKRLHIANTWVGAIVGGIPPLMGWAAASGAIALDNSFLAPLDDIRGWLMAALLFAWQFPHFCALSWPIKEEYRQAGYQMMAWKNPGLNGRVALRYSLLFFPICAGLWWTGVTDAGFLVDSSIVNAWLTKEAYRFWRYGGEKGNAKRLFWASVWHLPIIMVLAMAHKAGLWRGVYEKIMGREEDEEWDEVAPAKKIEEKEDVPAVKGWLR